MDATIGTRRTWELPVAAMAAYVAFGLFVVLTVLFAIAIPAAGPHPAYVLLFMLGVDGVAFHLALFPVVATLPAVDWGKAAGYGWLVIDNVTKVMTVNGIPDHMTTAMRLGGHIAAATWIAAAAWQARGATRLVGLALAAALALYSFVAPWIGLVGFLPATALMIAWLFLCGRHLTALGR